MGTLGDVNLRSGKAILKEVDGVIEIGGVKKVGSVALFSGFSKCSKF